MIAVVSGTLNEGSNSTDCSPVTYESSSVMGVKLLQSFISVVVMLLLLLSGDVETNPGPATGMYMYVRCTVSTYTVELVEIPIEWYYKVFTFSGSIRVNI